MKLNRSLRSSDASLTTAVLTRSRALRTWPCRIWQTKVRASCCVFLRSDKKS